MKLLNSEYYSKNGLMMIRRMWIVMEPDLYGGSEDDALLETVV